MRMASFRRPRARVHAEIDTALGRCDEVAHDLSDTLNKLQAVLERLRDAEDHDNA